MRSIKLHRNRNMIMTNWYEMLLNNPTALSIILQSEYHDRSFESVLIFSREQDFVWEQRCDRDDS